MTPEQMKHLWRLLGQTWGTKFGENYGANPNEAWIAALEHVPADVARAALKKLILQGSPFPPTLPEFVVTAKACLPPEPSITYDASGRCYVNGEPLPAKTSSPEEVRENLRKLRELVHGTCKAN